MELTVALDGEKKRDLRFFAGDDMSLTIVVYAHDGDVSPITVTNVRFAAAEGSLPMGSEFVVPSNFFGRVPYRIVGEVADITTTLAYGVMQTEGGWPSLFCWCSGPWPYGIVGKSDNITVLDEHRNFDGIVSVEGALQQLGDFKKTAGDLTSAAAQAQASADSAAEDAAYVAGVLPNLLTKTEAAASDATTKLGTKEPSSGSIAMTVQEALSLNTIDLLNKIPKSQWGAIAARTSSYDCTASLVAAVATGKRVTVSMPGRYKFSTAYAGTSDFDVEATCQGVEFDLSSVAGIAMQNSGSVTQIGAISADIVQGRSAVVFSAAPALSPGDWFCVYNPTDFSYSLWRNNYRAGEWKQVLSISGNTVTTTAPFYAGYTAASINLYRLNSVKSRLANVKLIGGTTPTQLALFSLCVTPIFDRIQFETAQSSAFGFDRCVNGQVLLPIGKNTGAASGTQYGFVNGNSQHTRVQGGDMYSTRHAITNGGGDVVCGVPVRDFRCYDAILRNHPEQSVGAADMHGNTESSSFENCTIYGAVNIQGGGDNWYIGCSIYAPSGEVQANAIGWVALFAEVKGGAMGLKNCNLFTNRAPDASGRGIVDVGGNSTVVTASTVTPFTIVVNNCKVFARNLGAGQPFVRFTNRGSAAKVNVDIQNVTFDVDATLVILRSDSASGTPASDSIIVDGIAGAPANSFLHLAANSAYLNFPQRMQRQTGVWQATSTAAAVLAGPNQVFPLIYPRVPTIDLSICGRDGAAGFTGKVGAQIPALSAQRKTTTYTIPQIVTPAAMTAGDLFDVQWGAGIREC